MLKHQVVNMLTVMIRWSTVLFTQHDSNSYIYLGVFDILLWYRNISTGHTLSYVALPIN